MTELRFCCNRSLSQLQSKNLLSDERILTVNACGSELQSFD